ncbi:MAG: hypothetical protein MHPSP_000027, partial [Paramarteilia canceri]
ISSKQVSEHIKIELSKIISPEIISLLYSSDHDSTLKGLEQLIDQHDECFDDDDNLFLPNNDTFIKFITSFLTKSDDEVLSSVLEFTSKYLRALLQHNIPLVDKNCSRLLTNILKLFSNRNDYIIQTVHDICNLSFELTRPELALSVK